MTRRLVLSYLALTVLILLGLEIPLGVLAARHEQDVTLSQVQAQADGLAAVTSEDVEGHDVPDLTQTLNRYQGRTGGEVSLVDPTGAVIASSGTDDDNDAATDDRSLVVSALSGRAATSFGSDEGQPWAAAAVPISGDNQPEGAVLLGVSAASTERRIHAIWLALTGFGVGYLVLASVIGVALARSLSRPLSRLESAVTRFGAGDLAARADEVGPPEVGALARQFNHMAGRLSELVAAQSRFVADASHQLRSPLTALRLRLENLEADVPGTSGDALAAAGREVQRLSRLVDGLLTLSRAESVEAERRDVAIDEVIADRCEAWSALAEERRIHLVQRAAVAGSAVGHLVPGDLEQILDNLLANALDASPSDTQIVVSLTRQDSRYFQVSVRDGGPGMSEEERSRAFDRFWRGSARGRGSSGLGLAIVRQLVLRNDGQVELKPAKPTGLEAVIAIPAGPGGSERSRPNKESHGVKASRG